ncbi:hypothetical protein SAMN04487785_10912 [Dyella jiangningensis]|uniref:hypothetical protein n=1 Tax=Dyella sp. AtDHG13 TaxID=1938897 RepID=UPI00087E0FD9|nr:hypothetical protein [Dyella sp. AtDHG13]PXV56889.1 hypothetical protein BDW41_10811 [Dyella sp. AtDHG13]SDK59867.1 hypothetical protein SAMN04487785_10912 [Dyella jiangningensis]
MAKHDQASLSGNAADAFTNAKNDVSLSAFAACMPKRKLDARETTFMVVAKLDDSGAVVQTWHQGDSDLATCFENQVKQAKFIHPPRSPFYTYFDVK